MQHVKQKFLCSVLLSASLLLSSCGFFESLENKPAEFKAYRVASDPVPPAPVAAVPMTMEEPAPAAMNARPANPPRHSAEERIARLEQAVAHLYKSLNMKLPPLDEVGTNAPVALRPSAPAPVTPTAQAGTAVDLVQFGTQAGAIRPAPAKMSAAAPKALPKALKSAGQGIQNIRIAQYGQKTRVVFDIGKKVDLAVDYDPSEALILVSAPQTDIAGNFSARAAKSKQIKSLQTTRNNGNTDIIFTLDGAATLTPLTMIAPNQDSPYYRYFFDIQS